MLLLLILRQGRAAGGAGRPAVVFPDLVGALLRRKRPSPKGLGRMTGIRRRGETGTDHFGYALVAPRRSLPGMRS